MLKEERQKKILEVIREQDISTHEELIKALEKEGVPATQATLSRDIRELGIKKMTSRPGHKKYTVISVASTGFNADSYRGFLSASIRGIETAGNLVVIKTTSGTAMAVAAVIDNMNISSIAGCIAGDDTIFVAVKDINTTGEIVRRIYDAAG